MSIFGTCVAFDTTRGFVVSFEFVLRDAMNLMGYGSSDLVSGEVGIGSLARLARSGPAPRALLTLCLSLLAVHQAAGAWARYAPRIAALTDPGTYRAGVFPDQAALRDLVARSRPVVAIPKGAVSWMDRPVYNLHWERNGELFFDELRWRRRGESFTVERTPPRGRTS